jgi:hypothetical protein
MKSQRLVLLFAWLILVGGLAISVFHYYAGEPGGPDGWLPSAGFGAPFVGAGALTLVGVRRSWPELVFVAVLALGPMSIVSVALFPFLILGAAMLTLFFADQKSLDPVALVAPGILALVLVGVFFLGIYVEDLLPWISIGIVGGVVLIGLLWPALDEDVVGLKRA